MILIAALLGSYLQSVATEEILLASAIDPVLLQSVRNSE